jgi:hypothetical protein
MKEILTIFITLKVATVKNQKISTNTSVTFFYSLLNQSFFVLRSSNMAAEILLHK